MQLQAGTQERGRVGWRNAPALPDERLDLGRGPGGRVRGRTGVVLSRVSEERRHRDEAVALCLQALQKEGQGLVGPIRLTERVQVYEDYPAVQRTGAFATEVQDPGYDPVTAAVDPGRGVRNPIARVQLLGRAPPGSSRCGDGLAQPSPATSTM